MANIADPDRRARTVGDNHVVKLSGLGDEVVEISRVGEIVI